MNAADTVNTLLETDEIPDAKYFSARVPNVYDEAIAEAKARFENFDYHGVITDARRADEIATEIVQELCDEFGLNADEDFETVITPLYKLSAELFPGEW